MSSSDGVSSEGVPANAGTSPSSRTTTSASAGPGSSTSATGSGVPASSQMSSTASSSVAATSGVASASGAAGSGSARTSTWDPGGVRSGSDSGSSQSTSLIGAKNLSRSS